MANPVAQAFAETAELVRNDGPRRGNCLHFEDALEIIYVGDIHGHRQNLAKIIRHADLGFHPNRRLILQEIIHGGPVDESGADRSVDLLLRAVRLKMSYPDQTFFLMGNHDLAQFAGQEITKEGYGMCRAFERGLERSFGDDALEVREHLYELLASLPLAARCPNGVLMTHSLPSPNRMDLVDLGILDMPYQSADYARGGSLYEWLWGRRHDPQQVADLAERLGVECFLLGHQPVVNGAEFPCDRLAIITSHHAQGQIMVFGSDAQIDPTDLTRLARPIVAL